MLFSYSVYFCYSKLVKWHREEIIKFFRDVLFYCPNTFVSLRILIILTSESRNVAARQDLNCLQTIFCALIKRRGNQDSPHSKSRSIALILIGKNHNYISIRRICVCLHGVGYMFVFHNYQLLIHRTIRNRSKFGTGQTTVKTGKNTLINLHSF